MLTLRPYQEEALEKTLWASKSLTGNNLVILPTGAGKSFLVSALADALQGEILILQPSKEILEQNVSKMRLYVPDDEIGIYSASAKRKDINKYTFATIQSIYRKPELFRRIKQVLIDEAHLLNPLNSNGMLTSLIKNIGEPNIVGLTATPFRNVPVVFNTGRFYTSKTLVKFLTRIRGGFWNRVAYNINNVDLVKLGYLEQLRYVNRARVPLNSLPVNKSRTDFDLKKYQKFIVPRESDIVTSILKAEAVRRSILVFCSSVDQAERLSVRIPNSECVSNDTSIKERERIITGFKDGTIKTVFNYSVLGTGFDYPELDTIYLLRPTKSIGLYYQFLGRGVRKHPSKKDTIIVDYSGSYEELGGIENIIYSKSTGKWDIHVNDELWHNREIYAYENF